MEHPRLNEAENALLERVKGKLAAELARSGVPHERWAPFVVALVIDLSGQALALMGEHDTERPPALCNAEAWSSDGPERVLVHCSLPALHAGEHVLEVPS
jgi:hypothetical protein